jgi:hypothetical protein
MEIPERSVLRETLRDTRMLGENFSRQLDDGILPQTSHKRIHPRLNLKETLRRDLPCGVRGFESISCGNGIRYGDGIANEEKEIEPRLVGTRREISTRHVVTDRLHTKSIRYDDTAKAKLFTKYRAKKHRRYRGLPGGIKLRHNDVRRHYHLNTIIN